MARDGFGGHFFARLRDTVTSHGIPRFIFILFSHLEAFIPGLFNGISDGNTLPVSGPRVTLIRVLALRASSWRDDSRGS